MLFEKEDWARIEETYEKWWNGTLGRPIIKAHLQKNQMTVSNIPLLLQSTLIQLNTYTPSEVIERLTIELENTEYVGDAFPYLSFDCFGPGILSAFIGGTLHYSEESSTIWFGYEAVDSLSELHFELQEDSFWYRRIKEILREAVKRWNGSVLIGIPDLGSPFDILSAMRGTQNLLYDIYDEPQEFQRISQELLSIWKKVYENFEEIIAECNPGYVDWSGLYSKTRSHIIQCDFSAMISPEMFSAYCMPVLKDQINWLSHSIYHLDGKGSLHHLDTILKERNLGAIQWVPGVGEPSAGCWIEVYQAIVRANKCAQILGNVNDFRAVAQNISPEKLCFDAAPLSTSEYLRIGSTTFGGNREENVLTKEDILALVAEYCS